MHKNQNSVYIRNLYSVGYSSIMITFFKTNLSFRFFPFVSKDATGKSFYDMKKGLTTTVNYDGAAALFILAKNIINDKEAAQGSILTIPCFGNASLTLERKAGQDGQMETFLTILKNNEMIPFRFVTHPIRQKENGQMVTKNIESGLCAFAETIETYLTAIDANSYLDLYNEALEKCQEDDRQEEEQIMFVSTENKNLGNNNGYQYGNYANYQQQPTNNQAGVN